MDKLPFRNKMFRGFLFANLGVAAIAAILILVRPDQPPIIHGVLLPEARSIGAFTLIDHTARSFTQEDLKGQWHLISYGFTTCPDVCPTTLAQINTMLNGLKEDRYANLQILFYSVDHRRDTPSKIASYVPFFNSDFIGLTHLDDPKNPHLPFEKSLGITAQLTPRISDSEIIHPNDYDVSHGVTLFLVNTEGKLQAIFKPDINEMGYAEFNPTRLRDDYLKIREYLG
ncbi:MAG: SCO family protein [Halieaceae bacterium]|nr:SCO family protein [Halieaceae bacterium]